MNSGTAQVNIYSLVTGRLAVFAELVKARLTLMVLITTAVSFYMGATIIDFALLFHVLLGTALVASGAQALNQYLEKDYDALMPRTADRPIPTGRIRPEVALLYGGSAAVIGLLWLAFTVNLLTSVIGAITLVSYVLIYTPLKRVTPLNTLVGAIPGALPPLMGWTAVSGLITVEGCALVAILFFWQLPHFFAISWMYRDEYAEAGEENAYEDFDSESSGRLEAQLIVDATNPKDASIVGNATYTFENPQVGGGEQLGQASP